jgi:ABC-2 type transport system permease protein
MLGEPWRTVAQFNPIFYLINGLRWTFTGSADVPIGIAFGMTIGFLAICVAAIAMIFRTGWRLRS